MAQQIQRVAVQFPSLSSVCCYGGAYKGQQVQELRNHNPRLVVATPGRLNDLIESNEVSVSDVSYLVLDEADRMLDMGFEPQIRRIINQTPKERQTLMWSATWPDEVQALAEDFLDDYIQVNIGGTSLHANHNIKQIVEVVHAEDKRRHLMEFIKNVYEPSRGDEKGGKMLIFAETKRRVDFLVDILRRQGCAADGIHGDKSQANRERTLARKLLHILKSQKALTFYFQNSELDVAKYWWPRMSPREVLTSTTSRMWLIMTTLTQVKTMFIELVVLVGETIREQLTLYFQGTIWPKHVIFLGFFKKLIRKCLLNSNL